MLTIYLFDLLSENFFTRRTNIFWFRYCDVDRKFVPELKPFDKNFELPEDSWVMKRVLRKLIDENYANELLENQSKICGNTFGVEYEVTMLGRVAFTGVVLQARSF